MDLQREAESEAETDESLQSCYAPVVLKGLGFSPPAQIFRHGLMLELKHFYVSVSHDRDDNVLYYR